jgi:hypothetical protein
MKRKYEFKDGDWCRTDNFDQESLLYRLLKEKDFTNYSMFNGEYLIFGSQQEKINEIPYNDMLCLIKGELPDDWCVECTSDICKTDRWKDLVGTLNFAGDVPHRYYGVLNGKSVAMDYPYSTEIQLSTWAAIQELNKPTLEDEVNALLKEDSTSIDKAHRELALDRERRKAKQPEFDPSKPFEVLDNNNEWLTKDQAMDEDYVFVEITSKGYAIFEHKSLGLIAAWRKIRNIPEPFHAGMLKPGECMRLTEVPYEGMILMKTQHSGYITIPGGPEPGMTFGHECKLKGRKVIVEHVIKEV